MFSFFDVVISFENSVLWQLWERQTECPRSVLEVLGYSVPFHGDVGREELVMFLHWEPFGELHLCSGSLVLRMLLPAVSC